MIARRPQELLTFPQNTTGWPAMSCESEDAERRGKNQRFTRTRGQFGPRFHLEEQRLAQALRLSPEERGAWWTVRDLMWADRGPIRDEPERVAAALCCSTKVWRRLRGLLVPVDPHAAGRVRGQAPGLRL